MRQDGIDVFNPVGSPNTDGVDPDSSAYVTIANSRIANGDDCVAIKSGRGPIGAAYNVSSHHITVTNLTLLHGLGITLGAESAGGTHDITVSDVTARNVLAPIHIQNTRWHDPTWAEGGAHRNIVFQRFTIANAAIAVYVNLFWGDIEGNGPLPFPSQVRWGRWWWWITRCLRFPSAIRVSRHATASVRQLMRAPCVIQQSTGSVREFVCITSAPTPRAHKTLQPGARTGSTATPIAPSGTPTALPLPLPSESPAAPPARASTGDAGPLAIVYLGNTNAVLTAAMAFWYNADTAADTAQLPLMHSSASASPAASSAAAS